jgi:hypothetical protein
VESALGERIGEIRWTGLADDQHRIPFGDLVVQPRHVGVGHPHAAVRAGLSELGLVVAAMNVDVALERIAARSAIHSRLEAVELQHASEDQIVFARLALPDLPAGHPALEDHAQGLVTADPRVDAMPPGRCPHRPGLAADTRCSGGHREIRDRAAVVDEREALTRDVDDHQALGHRSERRAGPGQRSLGECQRIAGGRLHTRNVPQRRSHPKVIDRPPATLQRVRRLRLR